MLIHERDHVPVTFQSERRNIDLPEQYKESTRHFFPYGIRSPARGNFREHSYLIRSFAPRIAVATTGYVGPLITPPAAVAAESSVERKRESEERWSVPPE